MLAVRGLGASMGIRWGREDRKQEIRNSLAISSSWSAIQREATYRLSTFITPKEEVTEAFKRHQMSGIDISGVRWGVPADIAYFALHGPQDQLQKLFALKDVIGLKGVDLKSPEKIGGASITYSMKGSPRQVQKILAASVPYEISDRFFTSRKVEVHVTWVVRDRDLEAAKEAVRQAYSQYCTFVKQRKQLRIKAASDLLQARNWPVLAQSTALEAVVDSTASTGASSIGSLPANFENLNSLNNDHQDLVPASGTGSSSTLAPAPNTGSSSSVGSFPVELTHQGTRKRELSQETQLKNTKAGKARRVSWGVNEIRFYEKKRTPKPRWNS
ncbi:hypothetical protein HD553DRAFT_90111 [Filobasidium floriforme]|uniref:uncharacterized protein n=1 Tax=Filobasidium floriforme TaxID=5210 RepID=UPI001E8E8244|nr:uncharacterized protein HD553DRAFT_90111 [Filobasidium floriforme]KAH8081263.1 hypothetical protein HD553DRAFT_90111 [Filobasidium floriforme]